MRKTDTTEMQWMAAVIVSDHRRIPVFVRNFGPLWQTRAECEALARRYTAEVVAQPMHPGTYRLHWASEAATRHAPEMLAALEALVAFADNGTPLHPGAEVWDDARAAITAAKGGAA